MRSTRTLSAFSVGGWSSPQIFADTDLAVRKVGEGFTIAANKITAEVANMGGAFPPVTLAMNSFSIALAAGFAKPFVEAVKMRDASRAMTEGLLQDSEALSRQIPATWQHIIEAVVTQNGRMTNEFLNLWKNAIDAIKSMSEVPAPSEGAFNNLFAGIEAAVNGMVELAGRLSTEGLAKAQAVATASLAIFSAIKAGVEALTSLQTYKNAATDVFGAFLADFNSALAMMEDMAKRAMGFEFSATLFESYIKSGAVHLESAFAMLKNIMLGAAALIPGGGGHHGGRIDSTKHAASPGGPRSGYLSIAPNKRRHPEGRVAVTYR